jgi:hypothetical protein
MARMQQHGGGWRFLSASFLAGLLVLAGWTARAQDDEPAPDTADETAEEQDGKSADDEATDDGKAPRPPAAPAEPAKVRPGDVVKLKNGKELVGVQVVRETPTIVEVQVVPGVEPISLLRKQVVEIVYDNLQASDIKEGAVGAAPMAAPGGGKGEISIELAQKLGKPVSEEDLVIEGRDVIEVINEFAEKADAAIEIMPEVRQIPDIEREWSVTIPKDTPLTSVLRELLPASFPKLDAELTSDRIRLRLKPADSDAGN